MTGPATALRHTAEQSGWTVAPTWDSSPTTRCWRASRPLANGEVRLTVLHDHDDEIDTVHVATHCGPEGGRRWRDAPLMHGENSARAVLETEPVQWEQWGAARRAPEGER